MEKLYNEFFYIPRHGRIREKVMLTRVVTSVAVIVFCLLAMSITAYAYFSCDVISDFNVIKAATFEADVQVQITDANGQNVEVTTGNHQSCTARLNADTTYFITLQHTDRSTAKTGFVIVTAENSDSRYHTQQLGKDANGHTDGVTFWIKPNADTTVTFRSHWGTSSFYSDFKDIGENDEAYILNGETVALTVRQPPDDANQPNVTTPTTSTTETHVTTSTTQPVPTVPTSTEPTTPTESTRTSTTEAKDDEH